MHRIFYLLFLSFLGVCSFVTRSILLCCGVLMICVHGQCESLCACLQVLHAFIHWSPVFEQNSSSHSVARAKITSAHDRFRLPIRCLVVLHAMIGILAWRMTLWSQHGGRQQCSSSTFMVTCIRKYFTDMQCTFTWSSFRGNGTIVDRYTVVNKL